MARSALFTRNFRKQFTVAVRGEGAWLFRLATYHVRSAPSKVWNRAIVEAHNSDIVTSTG
jgi:hypothetical protein